MAGGSSYELEACKGTHPGHLEEPHSSREGFRVLLASVTTCSYSQAITVVINHL